MCVQPVGGQSYLYISYGKTKLTLGLSPVQPPVALACAPLGPVVDTPRLPFWLSWYQRRPSTGSMRANMPSPPLRTCHIAGPTLLFGHTYVLDPLSCAPALIPG